MRYHPLTSDDRADMLARIGVKNIDALFADVPGGKLLRERLPLAGHKSELVVERILSSLASRNVAASQVPFFVGCGAYKHHVSSAVHHLIQRSEFLTSCTAFQSEIAESCHAKGVLLIAVFTEAISLGLLKSPGAMGADIVVGEGQSIGNALSFGGPYVGLFATRDKYVRQMPGRLCGQTVDAEDRRGFVLTLSTREQHIRREKATSNICTNSGLCCLAFTIHLSLLGEEGLVRLARANHARASALATRLSRVKGVQLITPNFFNDFSIRLPKPAAS